MENQQSDTLTHIRARKAPLTLEQRAAAQLVFLSALRVNGNVTAACDRARISRETAYTWREKYKAFGAEWDEAQKRFDDRIRTAFVERGIEGFEEPMVSAGKVVYGPDGRPLMVRKYSDTLLLALARSRMPEFRDKQQLEHSGPGGSPIQVQQRHPHLMHLSEEELDMLEHLARKAGGADDPGS